jgi:hypothetical protein
MYGMSGRKVLYLKEIQQDGDKNSATANAEHATK